MTVIAPDEQGRFAGGDRYRVVRELGRGGMGVVYLGRDLRRDMDVAIKVRGVTHHAATLWLKREFRAVAPLRHPNLVELYELVAHDESCYFTMEFLAGVDPRRFVERGGVRADHALPETLSSLGDARTEIGDAVATAGMPRGVPDVDVARVRSVIAQLADGLAFLHAHGVIHRDVKPSNAIVTDGVVKLLDFGLALERGQVATEVERETRVVGTAAYLAPEYVARLEVSPAMDVYSLGVVAYELVTGDPPFTGTLQLLSRLGAVPGATNEPPRPSAINPAVPADLDELIAEMLREEPSARPSAGEVARRLAQTIGGESRPVRRTPRFVGRDAEIARIAATIARDGVFSSSAAAGPRDEIADDAVGGRLVLVTGPSGIGKTALVDAAVGRAGRVAAWRGRCHERERVPYRAFDFVLDDLAAELAYSPELAAAVDHAGALSRVFPTLGAIAVAASGKPAQPPADDLRAERERARLALIDLFRDVAGPRALLVLDDLQWADDDSLELLALMVERSALPLTIVGTWTTATTAGGDELPAGPRALLDRLGALAEWIDLPPMTAQNLAELIGDLAPGTPAWHHRDGAALAAGSPYLAELIGRELAAVEHGGEQSNPSISAEGRRLGRLGAGERAVAELASLAGGAASFDELRALAGVPSGELWSALRALEDERIVRATPTPSGDAVYVFYHQRLRDAAAHAIAPERRKRMHRGYAELLARTRGEPAQLAYHWLEAGEPARAADAAIAAARAARAQLAWGLAADWLARALELRERVVGGGDGDELANRALRSERAEALFLGGKLAAAAAELEALARAAGAFAGDAYLVRAAEAYVKLGEIARGLAILDGVLVRRGHHRAARLAARHGALPFPQARARALATVRAAAVGARWLVPAAWRAPAQADDVLTAAYRVIASFLSTPYPIESFEYVVRGIDIAVRGRDRAAHAQGMAMLAAYVAAGSLGRFGDRALAAAQRLALASGEPYPQMVAAGVGGILSMLRGNWAAMRTAHAEGREICVRLGMERSWEASFLHMYGALGEIFAGEPARAIAILDERTVADDDMISRALVGIYRGRAHVLAGDLAPARALAAELERAPAARLGIASHYRQIFAGELACAEGDWARAADIGDELARSARAEWLSAMPTFAAMVDAVRATADLGLANAGSRDAAVRARGHARSLYRRGKPSFFAPAALRMWAQAERMLGAERRAQALLARARVEAAARGSRVEQLALAALSGMRVNVGPLRFAVGWATGGVIIPSRD